VGAMGSINFTLYRHDRYIFIFFFMSQNPRFPTTNVIIRPTLCENLASSNCGYGPPSLE